MAAKVYDIKTKELIEEVHEDLELLDQLGKRKTHRTPDFRELKFQKHHPLFVYGNLKEGGPYHDVIKDAPCLGEAITCTLAYTLRYWDGPIRQPILQRQTPTKMNSAKVWGEVYVVTPNQILEIDEILENNEVFKRDRCFVYLKNQSYSTATGPKNPSIKALAYFGTSYWDSTDLKGCKKFYDTNNEFYEWDAWSNDDFGSYGPAYGS